jgi:hypothetical protein
MKKKAVLVRCSLVCRVIVDESATEQEIIELAVPKLSETLMDNPIESIDEIVDDIENPYSNGEINVSDVDAFYYPKYQLDAICNKALKFAKEKKEAGLLVLDSLEIPDNDYEFWVTDSGDRETISSIASIYSDDYADNATAHEYLAEKLEEFLKLHFNQK